MKTRENFEAWATLAGYAINGDYNNIAWYTWQAATAKAEERITGLEKQLAFAKKAVVCDDNDPTGYMTYAELREENEKWEEIYQKLLRSLTTATRRRKEMTLQEQIDKVLELDKERTQGEWINTSLFIDSEAPDFCGEEESLSIKLGETGIIYNEGGHTIDDARFISRAPQMAEIIRKQTEMLKLAKEALIYALEDGGYEDGLGASKHGGCQHFVIPAWVDYAQKSLATIEEMEK